MRTKLLFPLKFYQLINCLFSVVIREDEIPADMRAEAKEKRHELIECVSNGDETIGELFLQDKTPSPEQIIQGIRRSVIKVFFVSLKIYQLFLYSTKN